MPDGTWGGGVDMAGRGRHYKGKPISNVTKWDCPSCHAENLSDPAKGCPVCGAGTARQAEAAAVQAQAAREALVGQMEAYIVVDAAEVQADWWVRLEGYTPAARITIAHALEHYAAQGMREEDDLPSEIQIAWGRRLLGLDETGAGPTGPGVATPTAADQPAAPGTTQSEDPDDRPDDDDDTITG